MKINNKRQEYISKLTGVQLLSLPQALENVLTLGVISILHYNFQVYIKI